MLDLVQVLLRELPGVGREACCIELVFFVMLPPPMNDRVAKVLYRQVIIENLPVHRDCGVREGLVQACDTLVVCHVLDEVFFEDIEPVSVTPGFQHRLDSADHEDHEITAERSVQQQLGEGVVAPKRVRVCRNPSFVDRYQVVRVGVDELAYVHCHLVLRPEIQLRPCRSAAAPQQGNPQSLLHTLAQSRHPIARAIGSSG